MLVEGSPGIGGGESVTEEEEGEDQEVRTLDAKLRGLALKPRHPGRPVSKGATGS
jgi:hypothetical protein